jgi:hypothetical protein
MSSPMFEPEVRPQPARPAISRLYGGIHFRSAIVNGIAQGRAIGRAVTALPLRD